MPPSAPLAFASTLSSSSFLPRLCLRPTTRYAPRASPRPRAPARTYCLSPTSTPSSVKLGFIGLGVMGLPMAANLSAAFPDITVWNRSDKTDALRAALTSPSATLSVAASPADLVRRCDLTFSMLSTPDAVRHVFHDGPHPALAGVSDGKCIVDCSTLRAEDMKATEEAVKAKGGRFLEAPVSGSKGPAEGGSLLFLCGGDHDLFQHPVTQEALAAMGKKSFYLGQVGNGTKMKLVINQLMGTMLAALGESIVLSEALELPVPEMLEILSLGAMNNPMFALKGPKMKHGEKGYDTNFPLEHAQKDIRFAQLLGDEEGVNLSVSSAANEWYKAAKGLGLGRDDFAAVIESMRASAGKS